MPGATSNLSIPYPLLTDPADIQVNGVKPTADFIDALFPLATAKIAANAIEGTRLADGAVSNSKIVNGSVTASKIEAQQAWQAITLTGFNSGDANGDGLPDNVVHYYKDSLGMVHFRGDFTQAASPAVASTLCTMPAGYRVGADQYLPLVVINGSGTASVIARSDGTIKVVSALGTITWSWSSIHYRAEN